MFGKKKNPQSAQDSVTGQATPSQTTQQPQAGKGRPTPSRREQEAARRRPLVPQDRKAAKDADRAAAREARTLQNRAMQTGDERYLPVRDRGPQRRFVRDYVDSRHNVGDWFLVLLLVPFIVSLFMPTAVQQTVMYFVYVVILIFVLDTWFMTRRLKSRLVEKFGAPEPGTTWYAWNRTMMLRRLRLPKPQVAYGQRPS